MKERQMYFTKMRTEGRIRIVFDPFRFSKDVPIYIYPEWRPYKEQILKLKPLGNDLIVKKADKFFIKNRTDDIAIVYCDENLTPFIVLPTFRQKLMPYEIDIKEKGDIPPCSYWVVSLPILQRTEDKCFLPDLKEQFSSGNILEREVSMIKKFYNIPQNSPAATEEEALHYKEIFKKGLTNTITPAQLTTDNMLSDKHGRYDFTLRQIYTIDGESTKDIDDAIEVEKMGENHYLLGIHIADVAEFVKEGTDRDANACSRGTSHYLANTVIHMLPEILSQEFCSLNENQERLAFSVYMEIVIENNKPIVKSSRFVSSVIRSRAKLSYRNVVSFFARQDSGKHCSTDLETSLENARELAHYFAEASKDSMLSFPGGNIKYLLDTDGKINRTDSSLGEADKLIEMFMIESNKRAGEQIANTIIATSSEPKGIGVFRVQAAPNEPDMLDFWGKLFDAGFLDGGFNFFEEKERIAKELLKKNIPMKLSAKEKAEFLQSVCYRLMLEAIPDNSSAAMRKNLDVLRFKSTPPGRLLSAASLKENYAKSFHFSLGTNRYAWFTSPIRRYCDIVNHRVLKAIINTGTPVNNKIDIQELDSKFKAASYAESNLDQRLLMFFLCERHDLWSAKSIHGNISMFRWAKDRIIINLIWKDKYEIPIYIDVPVFAQIKPPYLSAEIGKLGERATIHSLKVNDRIEIVLDDKGKVNPDRGFIVISDLHNIRKMPS